MLPEIAAFVFGAFCGWWGGRKPNVTNITLQLPPQEQAEEASEFGAEATELNAANVSPFSRMH